MAIALALAVGGCSTTSSVYDSDGSTSSGGTTAVAARAKLDGSDIGVYLDVMRRLIEGDPVEQAETFRRVQQDEAASPTTTNRLKLALALAVPNHPASDPAAAAKQLSALLSESGALLEEERVLAMVELNDVEQRLVLDATAERLKRDAQAQEARQNTQEAQRLQAALEENRKLKAELDDARAKLDAITTIEQSIKERENGNVSN